MRARVLAGTAQELETWAERVLSAATSMTTSGPELPGANVVEDTRFIGSKLCVPNGAVRDRAADVVTPEELVRRHDGYR